ncbi:hypothetical protein PN836_011810 [Ningiella sp. W23]
MISLNTNAASNAETAPGGGFLTLSNNEQIPVSRRFLPMVRGAVS